MTILLTGGTGYLGSNLAHILHEEKKDLILSKRANSNNSRIKNLWKKVNLVLGRLQGQGGALARPWVHK